ncbi:MAG: ABC transporter permease [Lachnospiraceae bacterium]|nr:ABC transporter permease [Lachnospiraceae bacterium]
MKRKNMFTGWKAVFDFTVKQNTSSKNFKLVTILIAVFAFVLLSAINIIYGLVTSDDEAKMELKNAIICDETGLINDDLALFKEMYADDIKDIEIELSKEKAEDVADKYIEEENEAIVLKVHKDSIEEEDVFKIDILVPKASMVDADSANAFADLFVGYFENMKLMNSGIEGEKLVAILTPLSVSINKTGEDAETVGEFVIKLVVPMLYSLAFYMMLILYGQSISNCIIAEKVSKLMETLLTSVTPYAVITGKVLGMAAVALGQLLLWITSGILGFLVGDVIAEEFVPGYTNIVMEVIELVQKDAAKAFTPGSIIVFVFTMCISFVMYCVFVALLSSGVKQADKLNTAIMPYMLVVMVGFLLSYMSPISGGLEVVDNLSSYIPPIAAYKLPGDILIGAVSNVEIIVGNILILATTFVLVVITGKIYKKKVF